MLSGFSVPSTSGYDGAGNSTAYNAKTLGFDPENRMFAYGSTQTDAYSRNGLRAGKQTGGAKTYFLYDRSAPVGEYSSTGTLSATNTFGADGLVSRRSASAGATVFYTFDERGNVV